MTLFYMRGENNYSMEEFIRLLTYFIIYSFLGWVMESIVRTISEKKLINTGFLHGPFCPIYGIGAIILFAFLDKFENNLILLFFVAIIVLTIWEYIVGWMLEKLFNTKYWDYSEQKFNIQGRVCLTNSICWGILGVLLVKYIHPFIQNIVLKIDNSILKYIIIAIAALMLIDAIISIVKVKNIKSTLERVEKLNKEIKEKLKEIRGMKKDTDASKSIENIQKLINKLKRKRNRTIIHLYRNVNRLKKAFPTINTKEITEVLSKKIDIKKLKKKEKNK